MTLTHEDKLVFLLIDYYLGEIEKQISKFIIINLGSNNSFTLKTLKNFQVLFYLIHACRIIINSWILKLTVEFQTGFYNNLIGALIASALGHKYYHINRKSTSTQSQVQIIDLHPLTTASQNSSHWLVQKVEALFTPPHNPSGGHAVYFNIGVLQGIIPEITPDTDVSQIDFANPYTHLGLLFQLMKLLVDNKPNPQHIRAIVRMINTFTNPKEKILFNTN